MNMGTFLDAMLLVFFLHLHRSKEHLLGMKKEIRILETMSVQILSHLMENFVSFLSTSFFFTVFKTVIMLLTRIEKHWRERCK